VKTLGIETLGMEKEVGHVLDDNDQEILFGRSA
jgi:hypothetical protein